MVPHQAVHVSSSLARNLAALAKARPDLAQRIASLEPPGTLGAAPHLSRGEAGQTQLAHHASALTLDLPRACATAWASEAPQHAAPIHVLGVGLGEGVDQLLRRNPTCRIRAWERDPYILQLALARQDWSEPLTDGRLDLRLGIDGIGDLDELRDMHWLAHPVLGQIYGMEGNLLRRLRAGRTPQRWIGLLTGGLYVGDLADELDRRGFGVFPIEAKRWPLAEIEATVRRGKPELVLAVNYIGGLAELCRAAGTRLAIWEIDPSTDRAPRVSGPTDHCIVHTYRASQVAAYRAAGFVKAEHRLLATNPATRHPVDQLPQAGPATVSFVGSSMVDLGREYRQAFLEGYARWKEPNRRSTAESPENREAAAWVDEALRAQRSTPLCYRLPELLEQRFQGFLQACEQAASEEDPLLWLAEAAAAETRLTVVGALGPLGMCAWGDRGWQLAAPQGVRWMGPAGHRAELNRVYSSSLVNVDIGRIYQDDIVTMRVFDVLACGGFLLAQHTSDLERCFRVGEEIETYSSLDELRAKVRYYLANPAARARMASAGSRAVGERHTFEHRLDGILQRSGVAA